MITRAMACRSGRPDGRDVRPSGMGVMTSVVPRLDVVGCLTVARSSRAAAGLRAWLVRELKEGPSGPKPRAHTAPWWQVMCLTGVDYFSSLGYQPGIAFIAAGYLSPLATLVLVAVTLFGALPVYSRIAALSPRGQGSLSVLEERLPRWRGKAAVLCLLGFAATDFVITITLSAADATAHIIENPFVPALFDHQIGVTLLLLAALGAIFLKGFREAIWVAVLLVGVYLTLNTWVVGYELEHLARTPHVMADWWMHALAQEPHAWMMAILVLWFFPKLALGLSGFETGVAVMPLVSGAGATEAQVIASRVKNTRKLLRTAAGIMSVFLVGSSAIVATLVPGSALATGGVANGRALAYLAHRDLGSWFGTLYDLSTIAILWFAGASAMAGLLNLVPRYLPRYGMAPDWARATRPLVLLITAIAVIVTLIFRANVNAQAGAYATGVLMLMTSAAVAVTLSSVRRRPRFVLITLGFVYLYTTAVNIIQRPEGIKIASIFIAVMMVSSLTSRALRSTELRAQEIVVDNTGRDFLVEDRDGTIRMIAHSPIDQSLEEYEQKDAFSRAAHNLASREQLLFLEIQRVDASEFESCLKVEGVRMGKHKILRSSSPAVPNAIAAILIHVRDTTGRVPHIYFSWTEGNPIAHMFRFLFLGEGDVAPLTHEVLRRNIKDENQRHFVHVT